MIRKIAREALLSTLVLSVAAFCSCFRMPAEPPNMSTMSDGQFIDKVERDTAMYFVEKANPESGLITEDGYSTHIGSNGFGLMGLCIAADRGWISRDDAAARVLKILATFRDKAATFHGALGWIMDAQAATNHIFAEGFDIVETAYVSAGALVCKQYFDRSSETERRIRQYADDIYDRAEFDFFLSDHPATGKKGLAWSWDGKAKKLSDLQIVGYHEAMIVYVMALGSPTHSVPADAWDVWTSGYQWQNKYGYEYFYCPALFTHQYTQVWLDLRNLQDKPTRDKGITYFENSRRAALSHMAYAKENPNKFPHYGPIWGLTDCGCPLHPSGFGGHGLPDFMNQPYTDDGTIAVSAAGGSIVFTPEESVACLRQIYNQYGDKIYDRLGFRNAFNVKTGWVDTAHDALNQGAMLCMIENYRSELIWKLFMRNPEVQEGLKKAGFERR